MTVFSDPLRLRSGLAAAGLVALLAAPGCGDDSDTGAPVEAPAEAPQAGDLASITFEVVTYVEPSANNISVLDRVRHELTSAFSALQLRQIIISQRRQVDVDLKRLSREPVSVVDPVTKSAHAALRVRYRFVGLAVIPKGMGPRTDLLLGLLQRDDGARAPEVIEACTSPEARSGAAVKQPWTIFNPALDACSIAIDAEQTKIDEARAGLEHPDREIVPIERERLYLPVVLHVRQRTSTGAKVEGTASPAGSGSAARVGAAAGPGAAAGSGAPAVGSSSVAMDIAAILAERREARLLAKLKEAEKADADEADDREVAAILARRGGGGLLAGQNGPGAPGLGYGHEAQPLNYALLWFASIAVIVLLGTEIRRRLLRRGKSKRRPRR